MEERGSRISAAKQRAFDAKQKLAIAAAAAFVTVAWLAWASHPGKSASSASPNQRSFDQDGAFFQSDDDFGGFDSFGGIAPSGGGTPQVQTSVS